VQPSKVELFAAIRRGSRIEGLSVRALARKYRVHRRTVREALTSAFPKPRKKQPPRRSRLDPFKPAVDAMLRADLDAPRKQRHTARRIFDRLVAEHEREGISYATVSDYVGCAAPRSGARRAGSRPRCYLFTFRLSFSGKAVHRVFASCGQEAFLEGHVHAFSVLGGIPTGKVRYDNLRSAVRQVLGFSRARTDRTARVTTSASPNAPPRCPCVSVESLPEELRFSRPARASRSTACSTDRPGRWIEA
jgi:transposase